MGFAARFLAPAAAAGLALAACSTGQGLSCVPGSTRGLGDALPESSGATWSGQRADVFWTVNDGDEGVLFAVDTLGRTVGTWPTRGGRIRDVEALAGGPCEEGWCLYLADTGDNAEEREAVRLYRVAEPELPRADDASPGPGSTTRPAPEALARTAFPVRFPDGPTDVEAVFVLPGERVYLVSKGRTRPVRAYRYPGPLRPDTLVTLEALAPLGDRAPGFTGRVTGASAVPGSADLVLVRTYEAMELYRVTDRGLEALPDSRLSLRSLLEPQGEAVAVRDDGTVVLTSEEGPLSSGSEMRLLRCRMGVAEG